MPNAMVRVLFCRFLGGALFRACALLVVQTDAWDRYGECATLCLSSFAGVEQAAKAVETRRAGPPKVFRRAVARSGEAIL